MIFFIPMIVMEELDHAKKRLNGSRPQCKASQSFFLDDLIRDANQQTLNDGLPLSRIEHGPKVDGGKGMGRLYFQTSEMTALLPESMPGNIADNSILKIVLGAHQELPDTRIILVSKDINMRIKAATLELAAEDYHNDQTLEDIDLLYSGHPPWIAISGMNTAPTWNPGKKKAKLFTG